ncbi:MULTISPECIES: hypothetical protein [Alphaproteobacteria]|uniref:hypothetical protein n=1 Tax=Alphaproteobacteria TaxID=28211 RepID=UPI0026310674|nr:hypothetical protein [Nitratireductor sp.]MCV0349032.1 hypothetical protein [Nitratireductor sp.]
MPRLDQSGGRAVHVAVAQGVDIDFSQGEPAIRIDCGPYGSGCRFQVMWSGPVDTAGGEQVAIDLIAKAEEDIRRLQPEYAAAFELIIFGEPTFENGTRYKAIVAELEQAYFSYLLCADNVGATELSILVEQQIKDYDLGEANRLVDRARERAARVDIRYGGVETADGIFDVALAAGSVVTIAGKFVVVNGVKVLRTAAGWGIWKEAADYFKAKGVTLWDSVGNLFGRTTANKTLIIDEGKFNYLFGRVTSNPHDTARSQQLQSELSHIGIYDTADGRRILTNHFDDVASDSSSIVRTFSETRDGVTQNFTVRESLLPGPGGFVRLETTFEVMADGTSRFITTIPYR